MGPREHEFGEAPELLAALVRGTPGPWLDRAPAHGANVAEASAALRKSEQNARLREDESAVERRVEAAPLGVEAAGQYELRLLFARSPQHRTPSTRQRPAPKSTTDYSSSSIQPRISKHAASWTVCFALFASHCSTPNNDAIPFTYARGSEFSGEQQGRPSRTALRIRARPPREVLCGSTMVHSYTTIGSRLDDQALQRLRVSIPVNTGQPIYNIRPSELSRSNPLRIALTSAVSRWARTAQTCIPSLTQQGYDVWLQAGSHLFLMVNHEGNVVDAFAYRSTPFTNCVRAKLLAQQGEPLDICDNTIVEFPPPHHDWVRTSWARRVQLIDSSGQVAAELPARSCLFSLNRDSLEPCTNDYWYVDGILAQLARDQVYAALHRDSGTD